MDERKFQIPVKCDTTSGGNSPAKPLEARQRRFPMWSAAQWGNIITNGLSRLTFGNSRGLHGVKHVPTAEKNTVSLTRSRIILILYQCRRIMMRKGISSDTVLLDGNAFPKFASQYQIGRRIRRTGLSVTDDAEMHSP